MKKLKIILIIFVIVWLLVALIMNGIIASISGNSKKSLVGSVIDDHERIEELMLLKTFGVPSDIIMMVTTYQAEDEEEALKIPFIFNALDFMFMIEVVKEYVHDHDGRDEEDEDYHSNCGYETVDINKYWHRQEIKEYLGISNEKTSDLCAANLTEKAQAAADELCNQTSVDDIRIIQFNAIPMDKYDYALQLCGVEKEEDRQGMLDLHEAGYFIEWLEQQAAALGIKVGEGTTIVGGNGVHNTIASLTAGDDTPFVDQAFISPIHDNWRDYVTCEIGGYAGHTGIDFGVPIGTPIRAVADGTILATGAGSTGYGNYVIINHGGKIATLYAHNSVILASGSMVQQGDIIALSGNTGNVIPRPTPENPTAGAHLHFEVVVNGVPHNPRGYLP